MEMHLVVVRPFTGFASGDAVTDAVRFAALLQSEHARDVVGVVAPRRG